MTESLEMPRQRRAGPVPCLAAPWVWVTAIAVLAFLGGPAGAPAQAQSADDFVPVTDAMLQVPSPDDWLMWRRTLDG